jgi:hypothetical protein
MFFSLYRKIVETSRKASHPQGSQARKKARFVPVVEHLEDRLVPATVTYTVTNYSDPTAIGTFNPAACTLRQAINLGVDSQTTVSGSPITTWNIVFVNAASGRCWVRPSAMP